MLRVRWVEEALNGLADAWIGSDPAERQAITAACHQIDQRLANHPWNEGESRSENYRITFVPPLAVTFRIEQDGQTVSVLQVRKFRRPTG